MDAILTQLRKMEIDIIEDQKSIVTKKQKGNRREEEEEKPETRFEILDDPVRMYLKQMGQVPLLTANRSAKFQSESRSRASRSAVHQPFGFYGQAHLT